MNRKTAIAVLDRLHDAQNALYSGEKTEVAERTLRMMLAPDITWHIPGRSLISGTYRGVDDVLAYFQYRRELSGSTFQLHRRDVLVGDSDQIAALTDGSAFINGVEHQWSTVGLYELDLLRVRTCWLLPLAPEAFDEIWDQIGTRG